jgi:SAM-dependent methyltransferase
MSLPRPLPEPAAVAFPLELFGRLSRLGVGLPGQRVLDFGTGTGGMAREFARRGGRVTGIDSSAERLAVAEGANRGEVIAVRYLRARAEATGLPDASADIVSAGNCWHEFDRPRVAAEVARVLAAAGRLAIAHLDWMACAGSVGARTQRLLDRYGSLAGARPATFLYPDWLDDLTAVGFCRWELFGWTLSLPFTSREWRARVRGSRVAETIEPAALPHFDTALARMLARHYPSGELRVEHRIFGLVAWR